MLARRIIGIVLVAVGAVWIAQGSGALHGSFMTGQGIWTVIGVIAVLFGIALLIGATRDRKRAARDDTAE
jgi:Na+/melibiose symporter-like transporter